MPKRLLKYTELGFLKAIEDLHLRGLKGRGAAQGWLKTPLGKLHTLTLEGSGQLPPFLFFHGLSGNVNEFRGLFPYLRRHTRGILVIDLPGHGWSDAPHLGMSPEAVSEMTFAALDQWLQEPVILIGNSLGGVTAIKYALHAPDKVAQLILLSPGGAAMAAEDLHAFLDGFRVLTQEDPEAFLSRLYNELPPRWILPLWKSFIRYRFSTPELIDFMQRISPEVLLRPEELQALDMPGLWIWGESDRIQVAQEGFFESHLPEHFQRLRPGHFTHCPHLEYPAELSQLILSFCLHPRHLKATL